MFYCFQTFQEQSNFTGILETCFQSEKKQKFIDLLVVGTQVSPLCFFWIFYIAVITDIMTVFKGFHTVYRIFLKVFLIFYNFLSLNHLFKLCCREGRIISIFIISSYSNFKLLQVSVGISSREQSDNIIYQKMFFWSLWAHWTEALVPEAVCIWVVCYKTCESAPFFLILTML